MAHELENEEAAGEQFKEVGTQTAETATGALRADRVIKKAERTPIGPPSRKRRAVLDVGEEKEEVEVVRVPATRSRAKGVVRNEREFQGLVAQAVEFLQEQPDVYGISGNKILDDDGRTLATSDLRKSVEYILSSTFGAPRAGINPAGTGRLQNRLKGNPEFVSWLKDTSSQIGRGALTKSARASVRRALNRKKKFRPVLKGRQILVKYIARNSLPKKISAQLNTRVIAAMKRPERPRQLGRGKRGRPREHRPTAPFRADRGRRARLKRRRA